MGINGIGLERQGLALISNGPLRITKSQAHIAAVAPGGTVLWQALNDAIPEDDGFSKTALAAGIQRLLKLISGAQLGRRQSNKEGQQ